MSFWAHRRNHGTLWTTREMLFVVEEMNKGKSISDVARDAGRSPNACAEIYKSWNRAEMMRLGISDLTIIDYKKMKTAGELS
jgi:hypothetical protein